MIDFGDYATEVDVEQLERPAQGTRAAKSTPICTRTKSSCRGKSCVRDCATPLAEAAKAYIEALPGGRTPIPSYFRISPRADNNTLLSLPGGRFVAMRRSEKLRIHDFRHTAASHSVTSGENLPLVEAAE